MSYRVQKISDPVVLGEGPHWDSKQQVLYFVSISDKTIHKYMPTTGENSKTKLAGTVGFIVPVEGTDNQFVVGLDRKFVVIEWDGREGSEARVVRELAEVDKDVLTNRINDGKVDPRGRLFAGTMGKEDSQGQFEEEKGSLYRLQGSGQPKMLCNKIGISNGLAWDLNTKAFYYIDSLEKAVSRYDYDVETGEISNKRHIFDLLKNDIHGFPDGMTIDTDSNLWVAVYNGSCVIKINPTTGKLLEKIPIPALQVTSVTFGGPNLDILFVTSASKNVGEEQKPPCGATFMVTGLGVKGYPNLSFKL